MNRKYRLRALFWIFIIAGLTFSGIIGPGHVQADPLTLKWRVDDLAETWLAPLSEDLDGDGIKEIVFSGTASDGTGGYVYAIDGRSGDVIWKIRSRDIWRYISVGTHSPLDISDLDMDGSPEILVCAWLTLALRSDGSLYWYTAPEKAFQNYPAVLDITGDYLPEIWVSSGSGPSAGHDYITMLSNDGNIIGKAWTWHPCFGGNTIGDTDWDGVFELYASDRRVTFSGGSERFKGGAMGIRALDAYSMEPIWNDPTILMSSHAPFLADVDKDGVLDVIALDQSNRGIAVYNSNDGSVVTTGGKYRKSSTGMSAHDNPSIYDIDGDGNLELISTRGDTTPIYVWDLFDWKLDAVIPIYSVQPPMLGDVTGDGIMDIIAVDSTNPYNTLYVVSYNPATTSYDFVGDVEILAGNDVNSHNLVDDIDGDGYVEIILTSVDGELYCYDTDAPLLDPAPRTNQYFYSEARQAAAIYIGPPTPVAPTITLENPQNGLLNVTPNPTLNVTLTSFQENLMDLTFMTNVSGLWEYIPGVTYIDVGNGVYSSPTTEFDALGTIYHWRAIAEDTATGEIREKTYSFTTKSTQPTQNFVTITDTGGDRVAESLHRYDADGDQVTSIYNWFVDSDPYLNLYHPFDTRTTSQPLVLDIIFYDGFENGLGKWLEGPTTNWEITSSDAHKGDNSLIGDSVATSITTENIDTSNANGITISFWFKDAGIDPDDEVWLQFWNGNSYSNIQEIGKDTREDSWNFFTIQTYQDSYIRDNFRVRISGSGIDSGETLMIDDFKVTCPTRSTDYSSVGNDATILGATWIREGIVGGAYLFDGVNDWMKIRDDASLGSDSWDEMSLELWIKPMNDNNGAYIVSKKDAAFSTGSYTLGFNTVGPPNALYWALRTSNDGWISTPTNSETELEVDTWYHIVATYENGEGLRLYINGTLRSSASASGLLRPGTVTSIHGAPVFVGYDGGSDSSNPRIRWFNGLMDELRLYPRAVSDAQITTRYFETRTGETGQATIESNEISPGEDWSVESTPNDSYGDGYSTDSIYALDISTTGTGITDPVPDIYAYPVGAIVDVTATPEADTVFLYWVLDGILDTSTPVISVSMDQPHTLEAVFTQAQDMLTISSGAGGTTNPTPGGYLYDRYSASTVSSIPDIGWRLHYWLLDSVNTTSEPSIEVYMDTDHILEAFFKELPKGEITIVKETDPDSSQMFSFTGDLGDFMLSDNGYISSSMTYTDLTPGQYEVTELFEDGWILTGIDVFETDDETQIELGNRRVIVDLDANEHVTIIFTNTEENDPPTITNPSPSEGEVDVPVSTTSLSFTITDPDGDLLDYNVTMNPDVGFVEEYDVVSGVYSVDVANLGYGIVYSWTVSVYDGINPKVIETYSFTTATLNDLSIFITGTGDTVPSPDVHLYESGTIVDVSATSEFDTVFLYWVLDGILDTSTPLISVTMDQPHTLEAVFTQAENTLTINSGTGGTTDPTPWLYLVNRYSSSTVSAVSDTGWRLHYWLLDSVNVTSEPSIEVYMDTDHSLDAVFKELAKGEITIVKETDPDSSQMFSYTGDLGDFTLSDSGYLTKSMTFTEITPGQYEVTELAESGWTLSGIVIDDPDGGSTAQLENRKAVIDLDPNEHVTVTFTNDERNDPPTIFGPIPIDGATDVPVSTSSIGFILGDPDGDLLDYSVSTSPDFGNGGENNVPSGVYTIDVSGLEFGVTYTWTVTLDDDVNAPVVAIFSFTTENPISYDIIVDNVDAVFTGDWPTSTRNPGYYNINYRYNKAGTGSETATWEAYIPQEGTWEVFARWSTDPSRATNSPYTIYHAGGTTTVRMNQEINGGGWVSLGEFSFNVGIAQVVLSDDANQIVIGDAVRFTRQGSVQVFELSIDSTSGGSTQPSTGTYDYPSNSLVEVSATPSPGYMLSYWELDGVDVGSDNPINIIMNEDHTLSALFIEPDEIIVDNVDALFAGVWPTSTRNPGYYESNYRYNKAGIGSETATWEAYIPQEGSWEVFARWSSDPSRATNAPYMIYHADGITTARVNQEINGGLWVSLGEFSFNVGIARVVLSDDANQIVIADAVRFTPTS